MRACPRWRKDPARGGTERAPPGRARSPRVRGMGDMSNAIAQFLTTRRARVTPEEVGLPVHGRRQVRGLRREEVASLAGVSVEYYKRLERGQATAPSDSVLNALAEALRLDDTERTHLFDLV